MDGIIGKKVQVVEIYSGIVHQHSSSSLLHRQPVSWSYLAGTPRCPRKVLLENPEAIKGKYFIHNCLGRNINLMLT